MEYQALYNVIRVYEIQAMKGEGISWKLFMTIRPMAARM